MNHTRGREDLDAMDEAIITSCALSTRPIRPTTWTSWPLLGGGSDRY